MYSFQDLAVLFEERFIATLPFAVSPTTLYDPCKYILQNGGKRIRPVLCLMASELFGEISEDAWNGAYGIELFHNFTLIHDDIMDNAPIRRGQPTIHARFGLASGILTGDVMCAYAYDQIAKIKTGLPQVFTLFNNTAIGVSEGQQLDMDFETRNDVTIDEYLHMVTLKTSVLLACSLKMGALVSGGLGDTANKLYEFGKNMGIAFQLQDDYLDAFGDTQKLGKQNGGDIRGNKKTYLYLKALELANSQQRREIEALLPENGDEKVKAMLGLYNQTGADVACRDAVASYSRLAFGNVEELAIPSKRKEPLIALANYLLGRDK